MASRSRPPSSSGSTTRRRTALLSSFAPISKMRTPSHVWGSVSLSLTVTSGLPVRTAYAGPEPTRARARTEHVALVGVRPAQAQRAAVGVDHVAVGRTAPPPRPGRDGDRLVGPGPTLGAR